MPGRMCSILVLCERLSLWRSQYRWEKNGKTGKQVAVKMRTGMNSVSVRLILMNDRHFHKASSSY
jgi:hypothetical protein